MIRGPTSGILGAFSEEQVSSLTGLSRSQLRAWNRKNFIRPEFKVVGGGTRPYTYIYSFKDLLKLRVLNQLRNVHNVPMKELERVERVLAHMGDEKWTSQRLWVANRKVVFEEPQSLRKREIASKQFVAEIALEVVTSDARRDIARLNERGADEIGRTIKKRYLHSSDDVFVGTRIPVSAVLGYLDAGIGPSEIVRRLPDLTAEDVEAAQRMRDAA
jgi:DNA-binding transcriptional MerR regulator